MFSLFFFKKNTQTWRKKSYYIEPNSNQAQNLSQKNKKSLVENNSATASISNSLCLECLKNIMHQCYACALKLMLMLLAQDISYLCIRPQKHRLSVTHAIQESSLYAILVWGLVDLELSYLAWTQVMVLRQRENLLGLHITSLMVSAFIFLF